VVRGGSKIVVFDRRQSKERSTKKPLIELNTVMPDARLIVVFVEAVLDELEQKEKTLSESSSGNAGERCAEA
jgi:hypothetical protein